MLRDTIYPNIKTTKDTKISRLKIILLSVAAILFVVTASLVVIVWNFNDSDYRRFLIRTVDVFSDYQLTIDGSFDFNPSMTPSLSATGIELRSKSNDLRIQIGQLAFRTPMRPLLSNTLVVEYLVLDKVFVDVRHQHDEASRENPNLTARLPVIIPKYVNISDLEMRFGDPGSTFKISQLVIDERNEKALTLIDGIGELNGETYEIHGTLGAISELFYGLTPIPVDIKAVSEHNVCLARGTLANLFDGGDLKISFDCKIQAFSPATRWQFPSPLNITVSGKLKGNTHAASLSDLHVLVSHDETLRITAVGRVGNLFTQAHTDIRLSGFIKDPNLLRSVFSGNSPTFDDFNFTAKLRKSNDDIEFQEIAATLSNPLGLTIDLSGDAQMANLDPRAPFKALDLQVRFASPTTTAAKPLLVDSIPEMGPVRGEARITSIGENLAVEGIEVRIGAHDHPTIKMTGSIDHLIAWKDIELDIHFDETPVSKLFSHRVSELGRLNGKIHISDADGTLRIGKLEIETLGSEQVKIKLRGGFDDRIDGDDMAFETELFVRNPAAFGKLFDINLPALAAIHASGHLHGNSKKARFTGDVMIGNTDVNSDLSISYTKKTPKISGSVSAPVLHLRDFGITATDESTVVAPAIIGSKTTDPTLFSPNPLPFDNLKTLDLDLAVEIDEVKGTQFAIDTVEMKLSLAKGLLRINPLKFVFTGGQLVLKTEIDVREKPKMALNIRAKNLKLRNLLRQVFISPPVEGDLHLVVDFNSQGHSPHQIASNLNGEMGLVLEAGKIRRRHIELVLFDLVDWLFSYGAAGNEAEISCGIVRYKIENGTANTELFFIDGPQLNARGQGQINLSSETIDMVINLEKKRLFFNSSTPILIHGKLTDPTIRPIPLRQGILEVGNNIFAPYISIPTTALGALWSLVDEDSRRDTPCLQQIEPAR